MAGPSTYGKNLYLGALPEKPYIQLHKGDPGSEGTANKAKEETRKQVTLAAAASGERKNSSTPEWTNVAETEEYSHVSVWDASSGGNYIQSVELTEKKSVTKAEGFKFAANELAFKAE